MSRVCDINGTKALKGSKIHRRGLAKKKGGIGQHVTAVTKRYFQPNLKTKRVWVPELKKFVDGGGLELVDGIGPKTAERIKESLETL